MMKLLVCGGRDFCNRDLVYRTLDGILKRNAPLVLIVGYNPRDTKYQGADQIAYEWAVERKVGYTTFPADWGSQGRAAGPIRNKRMRDSGKPTHAVAFPTPGEPNKGTKGMCSLMEEVGIKPWIVE